MRDCVLSGKEIQKRVSRMTGSWETIAWQAWEKLGHRGVMFVMLDRAIVIRGPSYKETLERLHMDIGRILRFVGEQETTEGLHIATMRVRKWLAEDVCPTYLKGKRGRCRKKHCRLQHSVNGTNKDSV